MKFTTLLALISTTAAIKIESFEACEYHLSEDGTECIKVNNPCSDNTPPSSVEKCPARTRASSRSPTPPAPKVEEEVAPNAQRTPKKDDGGVHANEEEVKLGK